MKRFYFHKDTYHKVFMVLILLFCFIAYGFEDSWSMPQNLGGNLRITFVNSSTDTLVTQSLSQDYTFNWTKAFGSNIRFRANMRYHRLGIDQGRSRNSWQDQYQPSGELIWRHSYFTLSSNIRRQVSSNQSSTNDLIRDNFGVNLKTKFINFPTIDFRIDANRAYNKKYPKLRDTYNLRTQLGLKHSFGIHNLQYSFTNTYSNNYLNEIKITDNNHVFRWNQSTHLLDKNLRISTGYNFNYRSQETEYSTDEYVYRNIEVFRGLYALDATPEMNSLDPVAGLTDNNIETAVQPVINIGENHLHANIGVDFGYSQKVDGLYIYTDKPSGQNVDWQIFLSNDNYSWIPLLTAPSVIYNINFNRYEIFFLPQETKFIKAVRGGINDVSDVFVTEIKAIILAESNEKISKEMLSHIFDISSNYKFSDKVMAAFDFTLRKIPTSDFGGGREMVYSSINLRHSISSKIKQNLAFNTGYDKFAGSGTRNRNTNLSYNLTYKPVEKLDFLFSTIHRTSYINGMRDNEVNSLLLNSRGDVWAALSLSSEISYNRYNRFGGFSPLDSWTYRISGDASILRNLGAVFSYGIQTTSESADTPKRTRNQFSIDSDFRLTKSILLRGRYYVNSDGNVRTTNQEYIISWIIGTKLTLSSNFIINDNDRDSGSKRFGARLSYMFSSRSSLFVSYSDVETSLENRRSVESLQIGIRVGF